MSLSVDVFTQERNKKQLVKQEASQISCFLDWSNAHCNYVGKDIQYRLRRR